MRLWDKGGSTDARIHRFTVSNDPEIDRHFVTYDAVASAAHVQMLHKIGVLTAESRTAVCAELKRIFEEASEGSFLILPELEDCHTAIEARITELLGEDGKRMHAGRSRNDQILVAVRLYMRDAILALSTQLQEFIAVLLRRSESSWDLVMPGYTHMQRAMPCSVGMWLHAHAEAGVDALRDAVRVHAALDCNPLGAASGFGVPLPLDRELTSSLLGFSRVQRNPIAVQNSRGRIELLFVRWCTDVASLIEKFACDCMLYSTQEFGFFTVPAELTTGSSIMPQKKNPDVLELMRASASKMRACSTELEQIIAKLPSHYHRDFQFTKEPLVRAVGLLSDLLPIASILAEKLDVVEEKLAEAMSPEIYATYEAYRLVQSGLPFRDAYKETARRLADGRIDPKELGKDFEGILSEVGLERVAAEKEANALRAELTVLKDASAQVPNRVFGIS